MAHPLVRTGSAPASRPRLLFVGQTLPYPPDGGVHLRTFHVWKLLGQAFDVRGIFFYRRAERQDGAAVHAAVRALSAVGPVDAFPMPSEHRVSRLLWDHGRSVALRRAYTWYVYDSLAVRSRLASLLAEWPCDLVHLDSLDLARYVTQVGARPVVCAHHNVESVLLRRRAAFESQRWRRAYLTHQAGLLARLERRWCPTLACNVVVSDVDGTALRQLAPGARTLTIPNGVDTTEFAPRPADGLEVVSVGGLNWFPNADAIEFLAHEIAPRVRAARPNAVVRWVGRADAADQARWAGRVELSGYVDDVRPYLARAACFVAPLRVGGGTRLKILTAWAMGIPVVSTTIGCEGLEARDGENILIRDDATGFADAVVQLLAEPALRDRLGRAGRATAERSYSWTAIGAAMVRGYRDVLAAHAATPSC